MEAEISFAILLPLHRPTQCRITQDWIVNPYRTNVENSVSS